MTKLCQGKGRRVHPVALPGAALALAAALTAEEQEVVAYLLSGGGAGRCRRGAHPPEMGCGCFGCYKSFWARWDASPNSHLIHRIIDAVEDPTTCRRRREDAADEDEVDMDGGEDEDMKSGAVGRLVRFIGEKVWGAWN